ncbi:PspC domain-containing protein [Cohnella hongkongensis]|uniref:PspC domain-containing protein n=1 Tax=Cohnella hongkongensis TaxID=178337 RepID=A0ABV9F8T3_9BACL
MRKLYRSTRDRKLFGVCGGLADFLGVDATLLRILLIVVAVFSAGSVVLVYIIAGFVIPREPYHGGFGPGPYDPGYRGHDSSYYGYSNGPGPHHGPGHGSSWNPNASGYAGYSSSTASRPGPAESAPPNSGRSSHGLDAMMEDIEKKSLQKEIEELKARISKFEKQSKGE